MRSDFVLNNISLYQLQYRNIACVLDYKPLLYKKAQCTTIVLLYIIINLFSISVWCPCMAINVSVQHNGRFLPGIILLTQCYYHRGTRLNTMKRFCICSL